MLVTGICHHIKSNLINCYVCFLSFSYILYNPLILFCQAWSLRLAAWSLRPEATSEIEAQRQLFTGIPGLISLSTAHWSQVHKNVSPGREIQHSYFGSNLLFPRITPRSNGPGISRWLWTVPLPSVWASLRDPRYTSYPHSSYTISRPVRSRLWTDPRSQSMQSASRKCALFTFGTRDQF